MANNRLKGILLVFIATASWGSAAVFIRFFPNIDTLSLVWSRYFIANIFLAGAAIFQWKTLLNLLRTKNKIWILINSLCMVGTTGFLTLAVKTGTVTSAVFLLYVIPLFVTTLYRSLAEKTQISPWLAVAIAFSGLGIIAIFASNLSVPVVWTHIWGVLAGASWGTQMIVSRKLSRDYPGHLGMLLIHAVAIVLLLPVVNFSSLLAEPRIPLLVTYGFIASVVAAVTFYSGIKYVTPTDASLISLFDPVIASVAAYLVLSETPAFGVTIGAVFILVGNLIQMFSPEAGIPQILNLANLKAGPFVARYKHG